MSTQRDAEIRTEILMQCYGCRPGTRSAKQIVAQTRRDCSIIALTEQEVDREADYLEGMGLIGNHPHKTDQGEKRWKITAAGVNHLEAEGWV